MSPMKPDPHIPKKLKNSEQIPDVGMCICVMDADMLWLKGSKILNKFRLCVLWRLS